MITLYRKYRPNNFKEIVGQNHIKLTLSHEIISKRLAHAYLFCGPRAVGKTTLARVFAKAINCEKRQDNEFEPCSQCSSCLDISSGRNIDIIEIDAASHTGVDNVRENIIASARVLPSRSKYKVFIVDEVHMLSISSFNALLKILEEPPLKVIFILCTTEIHKIPTTIISRCQRFDFRKISLTDMVKKLRYITDAENIEVDKEILESIARQSGGYMRDAESMLGQIVAISGKKISKEDAELVIPRNDFLEVINFISFLAKKDAVGAIRLINKLFEEGIDLKIFVLDTIEIFRKILLLKIDSSLGERVGLELEEFLELKVNQLTKELDINFIVKSMECLQKAVLEIKNASIIQLPLELAITELCFINNFLSNYGSSFNSQNNLVNSKVNTTKNISGLTTSSISNVINKNINISLNEISEKWNEFLANIKKYNHSLSFILRVCEPREINGNKLCLAFKYKFHKDRIDDLNIKMIVERVLKEVYGISIEVEALIDENLNIKEEKDFSEKSNIVDDNTNDINDEAINNILKVFGGKVIK